VVKGLGKSEAFSISAHFVVHVGVRFESRSSDGRGVCGERCLMSTAAAAGTGSSQKRILVVEDDTNVRNLVVAVLKRYGLSTVTAEDGLAAFETLEAGEKFDLILLDLMMPRMDGLGFLRKIRDENLSPKPPILAMTAASENLIDQLRADQVEAVIRKPFDVNLLVTMILETLNDERSPGPN
jgi:two-component system, chemotaxis family, chemotaxis protein CheY